MSCIWVFINRCVLCQKLDNQWIHQCNSIASFNSCFLLDLCLMLASCEFHLGALLEGNVLVFFINLVLTWGTQMPLQKADLVAHCWIWPLVGLVQTDKWYSRINFSHSFTHYPFGSHHVTSSSWCHMAVLDASMHLCRTMCVVLKTLMTPTLIALACNCHRLHHTCIYTSYKERENTLCFVHGAQGLSLSLMAVLLWRRCLLREKMSLIITLR